MHALDNVSARNHVNRMCLAANVSLVESGSAGYLGQVSVIKKGMYIFMYVYIYVCMYVCIYICMYICVYMQSNTLPTELNQLSAFSLSFHESHNLEQCDSSPFVFVHRKVMAQPLSSYRNRII